MTFGTVVKRYPLIAFCVLAYALSWWAWPLYAMGLIPIPVASFGPFLAALVVLAITGGKRGVSGLLRRMVQWRIGFRWYVLALLIPIGLTGIATALNLLLGATADPSVLGQLAESLRDLRCGTPRARPRRCLGGAGLERIRRAAPADRPVGTSCEPHPRHDHRRLAHPADGRWTGPLV